MKSLLWIAGLSISGTGLFANSLPVPQFWSQFTVGQEITQNGGTVVTGAQSTSWAPGSYSDGLGSAFLVGSPNPTASVTLSLSTSLPVVYLTESVQAVVWYPFEIVGGNPGDLVPYTIGNNVDVSISSTSGSDYAQAVMAVEDNLGYVTYNNSLSDNVGLNGPGTQFSSSSINSVGIDGAVYWIYMAAAVLDGVHPGENATLSASVDPYIYIDPSFPNAANYSVIVGPGIGNSPEATPEPSSLLLLGSAAAAAVFFVRRKHTQASKNLDLLDIAQP